MAGIRDEEPRVYPRHARSLPVRAMRQRLLLFATLLGLAAIVSVLVVPSAVQHRTGPGGGEPSDPAVDKAAAVRARAAAWIARWVEPNADVACDPLMCAALVAHGISSGQISQVAQGAADPLGADIVVATPAIRHQFGRRLYKVYAPAVLARFGKGSPGVQVRVIAPGAAAYQRQLAADVSARRSAGEALLHNRGVLVTGAAARELAAGDVDSRLLTNLAALVHVGSPVSVLEFGGAGPGASAGMPMLSMNITPMLRRHGISLTAGPARSAQTTSTLTKAVAKILRFLDAQITPLQPAQVLHWRLANGQTVVQVDFGAPTQFGVFDSNPVETTPIAGPPQ